MMSSRLLDFHASFAVVATHALRLSADALSQHFLKKELALANESTKRTDKIGATISDTKAELGKVNLRCPAAQYPSIRLAQFDIA